MKTRILFISQLFFLCVIGIRPAKGQSLQDYLQLAAENNPGLRARFDEYRAALERVPQVRSLPDPQLSFGLFIMPMERFMGDQVAQVSVMQMFPWFGALGAAKDEAAQMAKARYEVFNEAKSMLFYEVKERWYALYLLEKEIVITEENIRILQTLEETALNRYTTAGPRGARPDASTTSSRPRAMKSAQPSGPTASSGGMGDMQGQSTAGTMDEMSGGAGMSGSMDAMTGGGSMADVLRAQMEINDLGNRLALLHDGRSALLARFNQLINRRADEDVLLPDNITAAPLPVPVAQIPDTIRTNNPMLKMLEREEDALLAMEKMNRRMGFPMTGLGLQYDIFRPRPGGESAMNGQNMVMPMATISIPLWRRKYSASVREAGLLRDAVSGQRRDAGNQLLVSYEEAMRDYRDAERRLELYQRQSALAQQAQNILTVQYSTAGTDFEVLLRMQQQILDYRLRSLEAVVDQSIAVAMLERLMGR